MKEKRFEGKVVVVTASTAGIGREIARKLGHEGATVVVSSRGAEAVNRTVEEFRSLGIKCSGVPCHVAKASDVASLVEHVQREHGRINVLVSNAAVNPEAGPLMRISGQAIDKILDVNVKAPVVLVQACRPLMTNGDCILLVSSVTGFSPSAPLAMYAVSKTALLGLTKALAAELGPSGIRVNGLCPGIVPTKFSAALVSSEESRSAMEAGTLLNRLGRPEEMATCAAFLCSDDASYVTGENLVAAGGMHSRL